MSPHEKFGCAPVRNSYWRLVDRSWLWHEDIDLESDIEELWDCKIETSQQFHSRHNKQDAEWKNPYDDWKGSGEYRYRLINSLTYWENAFLGLVFVPGHGWRKPLFAHETVYGISKLVGLYE